ASEAHLEQRLLIRLPLIWWGDRKIRETMSVGFGILSKIAAAIDLQPSVRGKIISLIVGILHPLAHITSQIIDTAKWALVRLEAVNRSRFCFIWVASYV